MHLMILGRQPELGLVELECRYGQVEPFGHEAALLETTPDIATLGGAIKVGQVVYRGPVVDVAELEIVSWLNGVLTLPPRPEFGLSFYGRSMRPNDVQAAGLKLKKQLAPARFVAPQSGQALTAAQLKFNRLLDKGFELLVAYHGAEMIVAVTRQFQDIDWYAVRDRSRPARDPKVGMLPPKLGQILINTTATPKTSKPGFALPRASQPGLEGLGIYDPFCGTGVVLMEALLMGRPAAGSDASPAMVKASTQNLAWLAEHRSTKPGWLAADNASNAKPGLPPAATVTQADARRVQLPANYAIVSEGYLGPALSSPPSASELAAITADISALYRAALANFRRQLPPGAYVTLCAPAWRTPKGWRDLGLIDQAAELGYTLRRFAHADTRRLLYHRPEQIVGRQILLLKRI